MCSHGNVSCMVMCSCANIPCMLKVFPEPHFPTHQPKILSFPPTWKNPPQQVPLPTPNFYSLPTISHCSCTIFLFVLISYSFDTQVTLILILIDVQYSQNPVFNFEKGSSHQNHSSGSHHLIKKSPPTLSKFPVPHHHWGGIQQLRIQYFPAFFLLDQSF